MTRNDYQILFTALGFLAIILREDVARDKQALRATAIAGLIEAYCRTALPDAFNDDPSFQPTEPDNLGQKKGRSCS